MSRRFISLLAAHVALAGAHSAPPPAEALQTMRVAPGFEVTLAASDPGIRQPVTMSFDERGRLWVVQYLQYPEPAGLKAVSVDQYLRTKYDRVPEPPPRGPKGADKITICEDTNGDGTADKFTDFVTGLNLASGMALGHGGVFVAQPPYLLFYADKNRDDKPDGDPEVLLSGFGMEDSHAFANSLQFGPDGWLYGAHGSTVTANIRGVEFQQGIWRYHPLTREFELFCEGGGNTWGVDFNEEGEIIAGTNFGEKIGLHQVQGAYYVKGFAKHGPLHNPHTYGYFDHFPMRGFKGGHVTCGGIVYQGGAFPDQFEGAYLAGNLLSSTVYWHKLERDGSSWKASFGGPLLESDDSTFRPIDCLTGPDGALYVVDWCDPRASHVDPVDNWDKSNGRVYRVALRSSRGDEAHSEQPGATRGKDQSLLTSAATKRRFDLAQLASDELVNELTNRNDWFRRTARQILAERRDANIFPRLRAQTLQQTNGALALQSLWALYVSGGFDDAFAAKTLRHPHPPVRAWTVRLIGDTKKISDELLPQVAALARDEKNPTVRNQLACSAKRWPAESAMRVVRELLTHDEDVNDPQIPLLLWWAIEDKAVAHSSDVIALLSSAADWDAPLMRTHLLERLARRYAADSGPASDQTCSWLLTTAPTDTTRAAVLKGLNAAWQGGAAEGRPQLAQAVERLWINEVPKHLMRLVGIRLGVRSAVANALTGIGFWGGPLNNRVELIDTLGQARPEESREALIRILRVDPPKSYPRTNTPASVAAVVAGQQREHEAVLAAVIAALQNSTSPAVGSALVAQYPKFTPRNRTAARAALVSRLPWSFELMNAIERGVMDAKEIPLESVRQMLRHNDPMLASAIEKRWGKLQVQSPADKIIAVNRLKLVLNPSGTTHRFKGEPAEGRKLYTQLCATCHKLFGEGNTVGPELTGADRKNSDWLLTQIVDPSSFIRPEYVNHNVEMKDGRSLTGLIVEQSDSALTLLDAQNQRTVLNRADVKEINASSTSLMPEGLLDPLTPQQVRDLFAFLQSSQ